MESNNISKVDLGSQRFTSTTNPNNNNPFRIHSVSNPNSNEVYFRERISSISDPNNNTPFGRVNSGSNNYTYSNSNNVNNIDFSKIYTNKYDALNGNNPVKISDSTKELWLNGEATFKTNPDGSVLISVNGVPYGWTTTNIMGVNMTQASIENSNTRVMSGNNSYTQNRVVSGDNSYIQNRVVSGDNSYTQNRVVSWNY